MVDFDSLARALELASFVNVRRYDWRETERAHIDDFSQANIPHMDNEHGTPVNLNVECDKPA